MYNFRALGGSMQRDRLFKKRQDCKTQTAATQWGWRFHHLGIPADRPREGELPQVCGFDTSPYRVEWMRFDPECPISDLIRKVPHLAFDGADLDRERIEILSGPVSPSRGVWAMIDFRRGDCAATARRDRVRCDRKHR
jgi:hypothetical protein